MRISSCTIQQEKFAGILGDFLQSQSRHAIADMPWSGSLLSGGHYWQQVQLPKHGVHSISRSPPPCCIGNMQRNRKMDLP